MPQIDWPRRVVPCATLAGVTNSATFYVRPADRRYVALNQQVDYVYANNEGTDVRESDVYVWSPQTVGGHVSNDNYEAIGSYTLSRKENGVDIINPVAPRFRLEMDAGILVNYPTRPILKSPSMVANTTLTNPRRVSAYTAGSTAYQGSVEIDVINQANAGIVEAFIDQLYDQRNWFEIDLPGDHLGTASVSGFNPDNKDITISLSGSDPKADKNWHGWWVRVGNRTGRIISHSVGSGWTGNAQSGRFTYTHTIRVTPDDLITGTTSQNSANNFSGNNQTMRVRATSVRATGNADFSGSWVIDFTETDGST